MHACWYIFSIYLFSPPSTYCREFKFIRKESLPILFTSVSLAPVTMPGM